MKAMKITVVLLAMLTSVIVSAQNYTADAEKSVLKWTGKKVGGEHYGNIKIKKGEFEIRANTIINGEFVINMNSITCIDLEDAGYNAKLVGHLKSDDFFGVNKYPEAKLEIKEATKFKSNKAKVRGLLTIKGKTNPIEFEVVKDVQTFTATIVVDRSKYDVRYGSDSFFDNLGDKAIDDDFILEISLITEPK